MRYKATRVILSSPSAHRLFAAVSSAGGVPDSLTNTPEISENGTLFSPATQAGQ